MIRKGDSYSIYESPKLCGTGVQHFGYKARDKCILARKEESKSQKLIYSLACTRAQHFEIVTEITTAATGTRIQILGKEDCSLILWAREEFRFSLCLLSFCLHFCWLKYPAPALYWSGLVTCQSPTGVTVTSQKTPAWRIHSLLPAPGPCW